MTKKEEGKLYKPVIGRETVNWQNYPKAVHFVCTLIIHAQALGPGCIPPLKEKETTLSTRKHTNQEE